MHRLEPEDPCMFSLRILAFKIYFYSRATLPVFPQLLPGLLMTKISSLDQKVFSVQVLIISATQLRNQFIMRILVGSVCIGGDESDLNY